MNRPASPLHPAFYFYYLTFFLVLTACATATPPKEKTIDAEFSATMSAGRAAFDRGLIEQAASLYQQALRRARAAPGSRFALGADADDTDDHVATSSVPSAVKNRDGLRFCDFPVAERR